MIDRDQWAEIYDWARYNGLSPLDFIVQALDHQFKPVHETLKDEEALYEACRQFSLSRTKYPQDSHTS